MSTNLGPSQTAKDMLQRMHFNFVCQKFFRFAGHFSSIAKTFHRLSINPIRCGSRAGLPPMATWPDGKVASNSANSDLVCQKLSSNEPD
ncbi:hypothetical protein I7I50_12022 [Histoplasma capsulatum G186AR]|uniref:Uncharacterized protein n=1 Tax=Ajellomyces capsulatus TaxID=5037 RepID=A0A8H7Y8J4_AJECA|nr:hypothetical protein I7I52_11702 [Histoplasma capsulatum]QSS70399.1 hypothetical protein I7I50_12022 [Histoplasma capsulatum G186AR]